MNTEAESTGQARGLDLAGLNQELGDANAQELVRWAHLSFGSGLILSSSFGADSAVMLHLVTRVVPRIPVVFIDTGYLFPETYRFAEQLTRRLDLNLVVYAPQMTPARQEALFGRAWEGDAAALELYNQRNKVEPMQRALRELGASAWIAGLRGDQTSVRGGLRPVEFNDDGVFKIHPILRWSRTDVDAYLARHGLPYHPLRSQGYRSIGDVHSTLPVAPGGSERSGRRLGVHSECGLHLPRQGNAAAWETEAHPSGWH